eukprot:363887-Chlamydomonas_euryale.AAC.18
MGRRTQGRPYPCHVRHSSNMLTDKHAYRPMHPSLVHAYRLMHPSLVHAYRLMHASLVHAPASQKRNITLQLLVTASGYLVGEVPATTYCEINFCAEPARPPALQAGGLCGDIHCAPPGWSASGGSPGQRRAVGTRQPRRRRDDVAAGPAPETRALRHRRRHHCERHFCDDVGRQQQQRRHARRSPRARRPGTGWLMPLAGLTVRAPPV